MKTRQYNYLSVKQLRKLGLCTQTSLCTLWKALNLGLNSRSIFCYKKRDKAIEYFSDIAKEEKIPDMLIIPVHYPVATVPLCSLLNYLLRPLSPRNWTKLMTHLKPGSTPKNCGNADIWLELNCDATAHRMGKNLICGKCGRCGWEKSNEPLCTALKHTRLGNLWFSATVVF